MKSSEKNFAYIDANNLYKGIKSLGWKLDYKKFRIWLSEKYGVTKAYMFIGLIPKNKDIYTYLQESGFILIYKEVVYGGAGRIKGNCDADLVLCCAKDIYKNELKRINIDVDTDIEEDFNKSVIVTSDGDYACLVSFLKEKEKFRVLLSPRNVDKCSILLKKLNVPIVYLNDMRSILEVKEVKKEKAPDADKTA